MAIGARLRHELVQYGIISAYLYEWLCRAATVGNVKAAVLHTQGITYAPVGLALIKALILGKFLLFGEMARLGDRYQRRRMIWVIGAQGGAVSAVALGALCHRTTCGECVIHGLTFSQVLSHLETHLPEIAAATAIMLLIPHPAYRKHQRIHCRVRSRSISTIVVRTSQDDLGRW